MGQNAHAKIVYVEFLPERVINLPNLLEFKREIKNRFAPFIL